MSGLGGWREDVEDTLRKATTVQQVDTAEGWLLAEHTEREQRLHIKTLAVYQRGRIEGVPAAEITRALNPEYGKPINELALLGGAVADAGVDLAAALHLVGQEDYDAYRARAGLPPKKMPSMAVPVAIGGATLAALLVGAYLLTRRK